ncbi:MAG TPA: ATP-binding protein [Methylomirabilota bacterium]|jgi:two-component system nitrogen regulation sensor histidine kinase GlnL|nr:ATP-binding protein [Methylomirabilota bacterium]
MAPLDYEALLAGLPDAVLGVDEALRIVLWNPAAEALLGRSARRALGRTLKEVFPPETSLIRHLGDTLATGESRSESEAVVEGADGRPAYVSIVTAPLAGRSGAVTAAVAVVRDVARLRQLEAEMRRGQTLAAAGQIAMGLAHEIRNPLGAIRGAVQLLKRELSDEARWGEYIEVLLKEVDRVNRIIEMLLDVGRPVTLRPRPLNIHQLLERVALMSEEVASQHAVQILRRYDPSLPPIMADEDRMVQVFHNLVRNAIEAMPGGGRLTLVTRLSMDPLFAKVDLGRGLKSMAEVQVTDEGEGIPEATRAKLFTPFFTTKSGGLGLGLALCHRIVEEHKGAMQITSAPGKGTAVSCFLPIAK